MHRNGSSPLSPESSSSNSSVYYRPYSNGNSPINNQPAVSPIHYAYSGGISPNRGPRLVILNQPQKKFRFRYISEMSGTHGCLMGETNEKSKKEYIRVLLEGCQEREAIVRCTLVTNQPNPVPHVHRLSSEGNGNGGANNSNNGEYQDMIVSQSKNDWIASFSGLTIIHTAKKNVRDVIERRLISEAKKKGGVLNCNEERKLKDEADRLATTMDLHSVKLKFEVFTERNGREEEICPPVYSTEIQNLKSTQAGDLRIVRIDKVCSVCTGQEEIFIFVEKVNKKDIKVRFFEVNEDNELLWEDFADFSELDVHHQYAIAFKTPAYKDLEIKTAVNVLLQLYRPSNGTYSEPRGFTYTPREDIRTGIKRPRLTNRDSEYHPRPPASHPPFPTNGSSMNFEPANLGHPPSGGGNYSPPHHGISHGAPARHFMPEMSVPTMATTIDMSTINFNQQLPPQHNTSSVFQNITERGGINRPQTVQYNGVRVSGPGHNFPLNTGGLPDYFESIDAQLNRFIDQQNLDENLCNFLGSLFVPQNQQPIQMVNISQEHVRQQQPLPPPAPVSSTTLGLEQPDYSIQISPVDIDNNEDLLLGLLQSSDLSAGIRLSDMDLEDYADYEPDASCSVELSNRFQKVQIFVDDPPAKIMQQGQAKEVRQASNKSLNDKSLSVLFSNYSLNLAYALRQYAETGDLPHILRRMIHLLAIQSDDGDNALHDALFHNQMDVVRAMLKAASDCSNGQEFLNAQNNSKQTPLHISVVKNQTEAVALLLQNGADPNTPDVNGNTAIHLAATDSHLIDCLQLLLHSLKGFNISKLNERNYAGLTPLHIAVNASNMKAIEILLAKGADVNCHETKRGRSALHLAVKKQAKDLISLLLRSPCLDINRQSYDGNTALNLAKMDALDEIIDVLIRHGADPDIRNYLQTAAMVDSSTESDNEETDETEEEESETEDQSPFDLTQIHPSIMNVNCEEHCASVEAGVVVTETTSVSVPLDESEIPENYNRSKILDSGIDLMASKDLSKDLDKTVIEAMAKVLDASNDWERLVDTLDIGLSSMRGVFDKQSSPTSYLLRNLDLWDLTAQMVLDKLRELHLTEATTILEDHIQP